MVNNHNQLLSAYYSKRTNDVHKYYTNELYKALQFINIQDTNQISLDTGYQLISYFRSTSTKSNDTINKIISFFKSVLKKNHIHCSFDELPRLRIKTNHYQRFYHDDLKTIVDYLIHLKANKNSICYKTAVFLMIDSGCRVGELVSIKKKNIDFESTPMRIYLEETKNRKSRYVPFSEFSKPYILELMKRHDQPSLFWNFKFDTPFTRSCLRSFYRVMQDKLNLDRVYSHRFRKSFASILAENGMSLYDLQLLLDHTRISTTQLYVQSKQDRGLKSYTTYNDWGIN